MDIVSVEGGVPAKGSVTVSGAKNAASKMMIASLLTEELVVLHNVPLHRETAITEEIVSSVGVRVTSHDHTVTLEAKNIPAGRVHGLSAKNRISVLAIAPLLHRVGEAFVPVVDGDRIGKRPVNWHIQALRAMGAEVEERADGYLARAHRPLTGALVDLPYPSVGATETSILAGVLARGRTVIRNAAVEPEILELIKMLQKMGAVIEVGAGRVVEISGVERLGGCVMTVMPDPLEAASFASIALATKGDVFVKGATHEHLITFLNAVRRIGGLFDIQDDGIRFWTERPLTSIKLETDTYPGFRTDWQAPFVVVLTQASGTSIVHETVYESRFGYTEMLNRMGADITVFSNCLGEIPCRFRGGNDKHSAVINGPTHLRAADIQIPDIRAGLGFVLAALVAEGISTLRGVEHLDRGYERLDKKLEGIGIHLKRTSA